MIKLVTLKATTAKKARTEISGRWPTLNVNYKGYNKDGDAVLISMVRKQGDKANVATAYRNRSSRAVKFVAEVPEE